MKTLVLSGSIRSKQKNVDVINSFANKAVDIEDYRHLCHEHIQQKSPICNSDILSGAVSLGMRQRGAKADIFPLLSLFPRYEKNVLSDANHIIDPHLASTATLDLDLNKTNALKKSLSGYEGIVLVTPVYFGDRSSVANKFMQLSGINDLLRGKVFGAVAVGAKRNGGQETAVIYCLLEALSQGSVIVGNGPPTSQYGGTAIGGHKGTVVNDEWGLQTAFGTGERVAHASRLVYEGDRDREDIPIRILILITMDNNKSLLLNFLKKSLERLRSQFSFPVDFQLINVLDHTIYRCLGCDTCTAGGKLKPGQTPSAKQYGECIIQNPEDAMHKLHMEMLKADGIIIAGLNVKEHKKLIYRYQVLIERTRFIRRNHFELSDKLLTAFSLNHVGARINNIHDIKTITSYIRHNVIISRPIEAFIFDGQTLEDGSSDFLNFVRWASILKKGHSIVPKHVVEYTTNGIGGY